MQQHKLSLSSPFVLENTQQLSNLEITYHTAGKFDPQKNNVIWVCHALTGNSDVFDWWGGLFGKEAFYNPDEYFIVCANMLGSCYGTTGATSEQLLEKERFHNFPDITVRDMVKAHEYLRKYLDIKQIHTVIGGSMGGQQALEWAIQQPNLFQHLIAIATNATHSPWGIAFNESQRMAIRLDPTWKEAHLKAGIEGMKTARSIALLSYRHYHAYSKTQAEDNLGKLDDYKASSYQKYQGEKLAKRFNAFSYYMLSKAMDSHNVGRGRKSLSAALNLIKAKTLTIGIDSDLLFPLNEQQFLCKHISNAQHRTIQSHYGHDGFLVETQKLVDIISSFYEK